MKMTPAGDHYNIFSVTGFVRVMENLESREIFKNHFPGLESHGFFCFVMENISLGHGK